MTLGGVRQTAIPKNDSAALELTAGGAPEADSESGNQTLRVRVRAGTRRNGISGNVLDSLNLLDAGRDSSPSNSPSGALSG